MFPHCFPRDFGVGKQKKQLNDMITTAIVFDHRGRTKKGAEGPLEVRVTVNRKPYYINTGVRVCERQWQFDKVVRHPQADNLNERLGILLGKIMAKVNAAIDAHTDIDVAKIRKEIWSSDKEKTLVEWLKNEVAILNVADGTRKHYKTLVKRVQDYGEMSSWQDVTVENIYRWDAWLHSLGGNNGKITQSGVWNYHRYLKCLLNRAVRCGKLGSNPYMLLKGEFSRGDSENTEYLTEDEMRKIREFSPTPGTWMERVKDLFVFQMFTGLAYSDAQAFDIGKYKCVEVRDKITGEITKQWRIIGNRIKTGEPYVNQLLPPAVEVLEKYGMQVPQIVNAVYNRELKTIGKALGITTPLHSHLARHTFATWMLRNGAKFENVSKMLGHSNIRTTQRYAKVLAESVHEDFDRVAMSLQHTKLENKKSGS